MTLCGVCILTNQLGTIMLGIVTSYADLVVASRDFGRGKFSGTVIPIDIGPEPNWTAEGESYRQNAFELGVDWARDVQISKVKPESICEYVRARKKAINKGAEIPEPLPYGA